MKVTLGKEGLEKVGKTNFPKKQNVYTVMG